jgi:hypothetical protein
MRRCGGCRRGSGRRVRENGSAKVRECEGAKVGVAGGGRARASELAATTAESLANCARLQRLGSAGHVRLEGFRQGTPRPTARTVGAGRHRVVEAAVSTAGGGRRRQGPPLPTAGGGRRRQGPSLSTAGGGRRRQGPPLQPPGDSVFGKVLPERVNPPLGKRQAPSRADALCERGFRGSRPDGPRRVASSHRTKGRAPAIGCTPSRHRPERLKPRAVCEAFRRCCGDFSR